MPDHLPLLLLSSLLLHPSPNQSTEHGGSAEERERAQGRVGLTSLAVLERSLSQSPCPEPVPTALDLKVLRSGGVGSRWSRYKRGAMPPALHTRELP